MVCRTKGGQKRTAALIKVFRHVGRPNKRHLRCFANEMPPDVDVAPVVLCFNAHPQWIYEISTQFYQSVNVRKLISNFAHSRFCAPSFRSEATSKRYLNRDSV